MREFSFSPDGSLVIERSHPGTAVNFWNLRSIRKALGDLDWDIPAFAEPTFDSTRPIRVEYMRADDGR